MSIQTDINRLGRRLTRDGFYRNFPDLEYAPEKGIIPRGLVYEEAKKRSARGVVIVGMNPGPASREEKAFLKKNPTYQRFVEYFKERIATRAYYEELRKFALLLGLDGPILWTELVKCQSKKLGHLSRNSIRYDINKYLLRELECVPKHWPVIGVGDRAFSILSYIVPNRIVIGVPHVKARGGYFYKLFSDHNKIRLGRARLLSAVRSRRPAIISFFKRRTGQKI